MNKKKLLSVLESKYEFAVKYCNNLQNAIRYLTHLGKLDDTMLIELDMLLRANREGLFIDLLELTRRKPVNKKRAASSLSEADKNIHSLIMDISEGLVAKLANDLEKRNART